ADPAGEDVRGGRDRPAAEQDAVDVQQSDEVRGAGAEHAGRLLSVAPGHRVQAERLDAAAVAAGAARPVELHDLVPELARAGPRPPVHAPPITSPAPSPVPRCR